MYILCSPLNRLILYSLYFDYENGDFASLGIACYSSLTRYILSEMT